MTKFEISCINKSNRLNPHERILYVGGYGWKLTLQDAVIAIESRIAAFFVNKLGRGLDVVVVRSPYGHKYLKTVADGIIPNNLLSLPECSLASLDCKLFVNEDDCDYNPPIKYHQNTRHASP